MWLASTLKFAQTPPASVRLKRRTRPFLCPAGITPRQSTPHILTELGNRSVRPDMCVWMVLNRHAHVRESGAAMVPRFHLDARRARTLCKLRRKTHVFHVHMARRVAGVATSSRYQDSGRTPVHLQTSLVVHTLTHALVFHPTPVVRLQQM